MSVEATAAGRKRKEQELLQGDIEVRKLVLDGVARGVGGLDVSQSTIQGEVLRTIEGASQVTLTVHDLNRVILRHQGLSDEKGRLRAVDVNLDGMWFRLVKCNKQGNDLALTFEDRVVSYLRSKEGPRKLGGRRSPGHKKGITRAEAILMLVRSIKIEKIPVKIHELHKPIPVAKLTEQEREDRRNPDEADQDREPTGFDEGVRIAGLDKKQMRRVATCLEVADRVNAGERATLAMLVAMAGESNFGENTGSRGTTFQTTTIPESKLNKQAYHFLKGGNSFLAGGAIQAVKDHPLWTIGTVASKVEVSDRGGPHYDKHFSKARKILDEWNGSGSTNKQYTKRFEFKVDKEETYWDAIQRMANDVQNRAFVVGGRFFYMSEEDMFRLRARFRLREGEDGVHNIDFDVDHRKTVQKATVTVRIDRWAIPPGTTVIIERLGVANGKYLVESVTRSLFSSEATVTLKKPMHEKLEPKSDKGDRKDSDSDTELNTDGGAKGIVEKAFKIAKEAGGKSVYVGSDYRPGSTTASGNPSDHSEDNSNRAARDIGVRGIDLLVGPPSPKLDLAAEAIAEAFGRDIARAKTWFPRHGGIDEFNWRGYRIQFIWRTPKWGGHMGHIHLGVKKLVRDVAGPERPQGYRKSDDGSRPD